MDTTGRANHDLRTFLKGLHILAHAGTANAGVALDVHEIANGDNNLLDLLGQLTRGSENQGLTLLDSRIDFLEDRD